MVDLICKTKQDEGWKIIILQWGFQANQSIKEASDEEERNSIPSQQQEV